jgi:hypothetical protein
VWARRPVDRAPTITVVVTGIIVLAWQYAVARNTRLAAGIEWAPLKVVSFFGTDLGAKFALSVVFPVAVLLGTSSTWREQYVRLAWMAFGFGCLQAYGLAERGPAYINGNLLWSAQIACAVLYVASLKALLDETVLRRPHSWSRAAALLVCWLAFGLHVAGGLVTYEFSATETPFT